MSFPDFVRARYKTAKPWSSFSAGTECWAERAEGKLTLTFDDGTVVEPGSRMFCAGIDVPYEYLLAY